MLGDSIGLCFEVAPGSFVTCSSYWLAGCRCIKIGLCNQCEMDDVKAPRKRRKKATEEALPVSIWCQTCT